MFLGRLELKLKLVSFSSSFMWRTSLVPLRVIRVLRGLLLLKQVLAVTFFRHIHPRSFPPHQPGLTLYPALQPSCLTFEVLPLCFGLTPLFSLYPEDNGVSLLQLIGDPPPPEITQVDGPENSPAYIFGPDANTGQLARAHLPNPFYRDFALIFHLKSSSNKGGVVFSITDASQKIMYVGVKLSDVQGRSQNIILFYTEPDSEESYEAASFPVPSTVDTWTRFAIAVRDDKVMFYLNCEVDPQVMPIERSPDEMELEAGAGVFIGQAGGADPGKFLVGAYFLLLLDVSERHI